MIYYLIFIFSIILEIDPLSKPLFWTLNSCSFTNTIFTFSCIYHQEFHIESEESYMCRWRFCMFTMIFFELTTSVINCLSIFSYYYKYFVLGTFICNFIKALCPFIFRIRYSLSSFPIIFMFYGFYEALESERIFPVSDKYLVDSVNVI